MDQTPLGRLRLMTVLGTRPEIIRLSQVIKRCDQYFDHILVHTGQNWDYELNEIFFRDLSLRRPDHFLNVSGGDLGQTIGNIISSSYSLIKETSPDAFLVLGDTNSALSAISAKRLKVPIFHMEAGNRCFDENLPEETNRRIVDHIADVNLCYSEHARRYLHAEGVRKEHVYVTGSPMAEVLEANMEKIRGSAVLGELGLEKGGYILLSAHREENIDIEENFVQLMGSVNALAEKYGLPVIYSTHPRSAKRIKDSGIALHPNVRSLKPFSFSDYNCLQINAYCVISDSGTLPEEAAYFAFPAVSVRTSTERPEALDKGCFVIGCLSSGRILQAVDMAVSMRREGVRPSRVPDYDDTGVSARVAGIIQSYTGIIAKKVWGRG